MTINIMHEYLEKIVKEKIVKYMRLIFEYKYHKEIVERFIYSYIKVRYNNYTTIHRELEEGIHLRQKILETLQNTQNILMKDFPKEENSIKNVHKFFYYVLYFDGVVYYKNSEDKIEKIYKTRVKELHKNEESFKENLKNLLEEYDKKEEEFFERFKTEEFTLKIKEYDKKNVYKVTIKANIKFPELYSETAIKKAFYTGLVREEKLYIEYYLVVLKIIKDLKKLNFKRQYVVEFSDTLLKKEKKIKGILNIIQDVAVQDKLSLKIKYKSYQEHREEIEKLIKEGYHFAVILDDSFEANYYNVEKLNLFRYVIVNKLLNNYEEIMQFKNRIKNRIDI